MTLTLASGLALASVRAADETAKLLPIYGKVSAALAADNLADAQATACALAAEATLLRAPGIAERAAKLGKAADLTGAREAFKDLSGAIIPLARKHAGWFIINCPMANADWVQPSRTVANPYLGREMSTCGTVTEATKG